MAVVVKIEITKISLQLLLMMLTLVDNGGDVAGGALTTKMIDEIVAREITELLSSTPIAHPHGFLFMPELNTGFSR
eukprot:scaffold536468_cov34-Prasinocladus_malaysianus.AAC.1